MGVKNKILEINPLVIEQIQADIKNDSVYFYEIEKIPKFLIDKNLLNVNMLKKCSGVAVAVSGCESEGRNYLMIMGLRVGTENGRVETDLDPIIMVADLKSGSPAPSGCVCFHGNFDRRTVSEPLIVRPLDTVVSDLRRNFKAGKKTFNKADIRFTNAMHYMAQHTTVRLITE